MRVQLNFLRNIHLLGYLLDKLNGKNLDEHHLNVHKFHLIVYLNAHLIVVLNEHLNVI